MNENRFIVNKLDYETITSLHRFVDDSLRIIIPKSNNAAVEIKKYRKKRSLNANALYWVWNTEIADHLNYKKVPAYKKNKKTGELLPIPWSKMVVHVMFKHEFLQADTYKLGNHVFIDNDIPSTRDLSDSEFCFYMTQVEKWAYNMLGLILPTPLESEYKEYLDKQDGVIIH